MKPTGQLTILLNQNNFFLASFQILIIISIGNFSFHFQSKTHFACLFSVCLWELEIIRKSQKWALNPNLCICNRRKTIQLRLRKFFNFKFKRQRLEESEDQGFCCIVVSLKRESKRERHRDRNRQTEKEA